MFDQTEFRDFAQEFFTDKYGAIIPKEQQSPECLSFLMTVARQERFCHINFDGCLRTILAIRVGPSMNMDPAVMRRFCSLMERAELSEPLGGIIEDTESGLFWTQETNVAALDLTTGGPALASVLVYAESDLPRLDVLCGLASLPLLGNALPKLPPIDLCYARGSA